MGLLIRKRLPISRTAHVNLSTAGVSVAKRVGRVTLNSRGRVSIRILPGISYRVQL